MKLFGQKPPKSMIKKITVKDVAAVQNDPEVTAYVQKAGAELGEKGRFVVKLTDLPQEISILVEAKTEKKCEQLIGEFHKLLVQKGYAECPHVWETLYSNDLGECDYNSYGAAVEHYIVTLECCKWCGALVKEGEGPYMGDPSELLEITEEDRKLAGQAGS